MLILKVWKRKETVAEIIDGIVDNEIIKAMKSEEATQKVAALYFVGRRLRDTLFLFPFLPFFFFVLWIDVEGAVKIQEKEYSKYCHRLKINTNSAVCSETSGNDDMKSNFCVELGRI
jgi:hypothetical protein